MWSEVGDQTGSRADRSGVIPCKGDFEPDKENGTGLPIHGEGFVVSAACSPSCILLDHPVPNILNLIVQLVQFLEHHGLIRNCDDIRESLVF